MDISTFTTFIVNTSSTFFIWPNFLNIKLQHTFCISRVSALHNHQDQNTDFNKWNNKDTSETFQGNSIGGVRDMLVGGKKGIIENISILTLRHYFRSLKHRQLWSNQQQSLAQNHLLWTCVQVSQSLTHCDFPTSGISPPIETVFLRPAATIS